LRGGRGEIDDQGGALAGQVRHTDVGDAYHVAELLLQFQDAGEIAAHVETRLAGRFVRGGRGRRWRRRGGASIGGYLAWSGRWSWGGRLGCQGEAHALELDDQQFHAGDGGLIFGAKATDGREQQIQYFFGQGGASSLDSAHYRAAEQYARLTRGRWAVWAGQQPRLARIA
jgi:hypothetical protein